jgi:hypothetical protein
MSQGWKPAIVGANLTDVPDEDLATYQGTEKDAWSQFWEECAADRDVKAAFEAAYEADDMRIVEV